MLADTSILPAFACRVDTQESRDIYVVDGFVWKFDTWNEVIDWQCFIEWGMQSIIEDDDKQYFVPIVAAGYGWVKQPFIDGLIVPTPSKEHLDMYYDILCPLIAKYDLIDLCEDKNWGIDPNTNQPVIFDYGLVGYGMMKNMIDRMKEIGYPGD